MDVMVALSLGTIGTIPSFHGLFDPLGDHIYYFLLTQELHLKLLLVAILNRSKIDFVGAS